MLLLLLLREGITVCKYVGRDFHWELTAWVSGRVPTSDYPVVCRDIALRKGNMKHYVKGEREFLL